MGMRFHVRLLAWVAGVFNQIAAIRDLSGDLSGDWQNIGEEHADAGAVSATGYATRADRYRAQLGRGLLERVELAFHRGVVNELGLRHQEVMKEYQLRTSSTADITEALEHRWECEEALSAGETKKTTSDLYDAKQVVKTLGLSVTSAMRKTRADLKKPIERVVQECVTNLAKKGETRQRSYLRFWSGAGRKSAALTRPAEESVAGSTLLDLVPKYFKAENDRNFLDYLSFSKMRKRDDTKRAIKGLTSQVKSLDSQMRKGWGFNLYNTRGHCARVHKDETMDFEERVVEGLIGEISGQTAKINDVCQELPGKSCPEGLYPLHVRQKQTRRAARMFGITFVAYGPISLMFPFIGWAVAGASGAALAAVTLATPGPGFIVAAAVSAAAAVPWLGECRCVAEPCQYDANLESCTLVVQPGTSNKYPWLPYIGLKCAPVQVQVGEPPKCALTACDSEDFSNEFKTVDGRQVYGKLGGLRDTAGDRAGVYNCVSTDGTIAQNWEVLHELPDLTKPEGGVLENSIENRRLLYDVLAPVAPANKTSIQVLSE